MDLQKTVNQKLEEMISNGSIEKMIQDQLETCIKDSLESAMRSYGDFGKAIQGKLKESIENSLDRVSFPEYNTIMVKAAKETYENFMNEEAAKACSNVFQKELKPVPDKINFYDFGKEIIDCWREYAENEMESEIEVDWEQSNDAIYMTLKHPCYDWENVKVTLYNHRDKGYQIGYINSDRDDTKKAQAASNMFTGVQGYLFKLYSNHTVFTDIEENIHESISWCDY